jgi:hypothetical protein
VIMPGVAVVVCVLAHVLDTLDLLLLSKLVED